MNQIEVSKRLPLFKIEIFEDVDGAGHVAISECHDPKDASTSTVQLYVFSAMPLALLYEVPCLPTRCNRQ